MPIWKSAGWSVDEYEILENHLDWPDVEAKKCHKLVHNGYQNQKICEYELVAYLIDHLRLNKDVCQAEQCHCTEDAHDDAAQKQETATFSQQCRATEWNKNDSRTNQGGNNDRWFNWDHQIQ